MLFVPILLFGGIDEVLWIQIEQESLYLGYCHNKNIFILLIPMTMNNLYGLVAFILTIPIRNLADNFHDCKAVFICLVSHFVICIIINTIILLLSKQKEEFWYQLIIFTTYCDFLLEVPYQLNNAENHVIK